MIPKITINYEMIRYKIQIIKIDHKLRKLQKQAIKIIHKQDLLINKKELLDSIMIDLEKKRLIQNDKRI